MSTLKNVLIISCLFFTLFTAGCTGTPAPTPTPLPTTMPVSPTPVSVLTPTLTPTSSGVIEWNPSVTPTRYVNGTVTLNDQPTSNFNVILETSKGNIYGVPTDARGNFSVKFPDDGSAGYIIKIADQGKNLIYQDNSPRPINQSGPLNVSIEIPGPNQISVKVT